MSIKRRILIVDEDPDNCENLQKLLILDDYEFLHAHSDSDTKEMVKQHLPDLILLDVIAPSMDGFKICENLRAMDETGTIPIIMIIDWNDRAFRLMALEAGADSFIFKPYDPVEMRAQVNNTLRLNRFQHLLAERAKFELVVDAADQGYMLINEEGHSIFANAKARNYLGLSIEDTHLNKHFLELAQREYHLEPEEAWQNWTETLDSSTPHYLIRPETEHSQAFWLQINMMGYLIADSGIVYMIELRDVTQTKESEIRAWKFEHTIAHKMGTPLTTILGSLESVQSLNSPQISGSTQTFLELAYRSAQNLQQSIQEILNYMEARHWNIDRGRLALEDIDSMIQALCITLRIDPDKVTVLNAHQYEQRHLVLDGNSMELLLWEMLGNAQKFHTTQSPTIEINLLSHSSDTVTIQIIDDGQTLTPEQLAQVWVPYYQADKFFTGNVKGMGLGLTIVASIIWNVGGKCSIRNRPDGSGILAELVLPLMKKQITSDDE